MIHPRKISFLICLSLVLATAAPAAISLVDASLVSAQAMSDRPLVVVRFNQRKVYFEQPLYTAVSKAVQVKPDVSFQLISYVPRTGNEEKDMQLLSNASQNTKNVADSLVKMGVPKQRISMATEFDPSLRFDETHIFVQ